MLLGFQPGKAPGGGALRRVVQAQRVGQRKDKMDQAMMVGRVKWFNDQKGFGFIDCNGVQYFFHRSAVRGGDFNRLQKSQEVTFIVRPSPKGPRAEDVAPA